MKTQKVKTDDLGDETKAQTRRKFMQTGAAALATMSATLSPARATSNNAAPSSWAEPGGDFSNYGQPHVNQERAIRWISRNSAVPGDGVSWSPLHELEGMLTPNGLHFERHHNGVPTVDAQQWEISLHGLVNTPIAFTLEALHRYPMTSKIAFIECGGNSNSMWHKTPVQAPTGYIHGLVSCSEWTGVRLSTLLNEAGLASNAQWLVAEGLDSSGVVVSLPIEKILDDTLIALYQNGEAIRPENGYPARLLVPGWEGIVNVKWLKDLQVTDRPLMSRFDTVSYTDLQKDGKARRFSHEMSVKSVITSPSPGYTLSEAGQYEIRGLAWTGAGKIERVEVSTDNGTSWMRAVLQGPVSDKAFTRFRLPWLWDGKPTTLKSRAIDQNRNVQPERPELITKKGSSHYYHFNGISVWSIDSDGRVSHVYS